MSPDLPVTSWNSHFRVGYGADFKLQKANANERWGISVASPARHSADFRAEVTFAAHQIAQSSKGKDLYLYCDGSYESQAMVQAFYWARAKFEVTVPRVEPLVNTMAFSHAVQMLEHFSIPYTVFDLELKGFLEGTQAADWVTKYNSDNLPQLIAMAAWQSLGSDRTHFVFPYGLVEFSPSSEGWRSVDRESSYGLCRFQMGESSLGVPAFFKWNSELQAAYLNDPILRSIIFNSRKVGEWTDAIHKDILQNYFRIFGDKNQKNLPTSALAQFKSFLHRALDGKRVSASQHIVPVADLIHAMTFRPARQNQLRSAR